MITTTGRGKEREHTVKCENCGHEGLVTVAEFDSSQMVAVTDRFSYRDNVVSCKSCRTSVFEVPRDPVTAA